MSRAKDDRPTSGADRHSLKSMIFTILHNRSKEVVMIVAWNLTFSDRINLHEDKCQCSQFSSYSNCPCVEAKACLKYKRKMKKFEDNMDVGKLFFYICPSCS